MECLHHGEPELKQSQDTCYICGCDDTIFRDLTHNMTACNSSIEEKLLEIVTLDAGTSRHSEVVCQACFALLEEIVKLQSTLYVLIQDVNDKISRTCHQLCIEDENACNNDSEQDCDDAADGSATDARGDCDSPPSPGGALSSPTCVTTGPSPSAGATNAPPSPVYTAEADPAPAGQDVDPMSAGGATSTPSPLVCADCPGRTFASVASLRRHHRKKHERHLTCPFCQRPVRETYLEMHILIKHSRTEGGSRTFLCTLCNRQYESAKYLKVHLRTVHSTTATGKQYQCTECGRLLANRGSLHAHIQRHARSLQCGVCGRRFALRTQLETHSRHHTGERPFLCDDCGKAFISAEGLRKHAQVHAATPTCDTCGRTFASRAGLDAHRRTHSDERPFCCSACGKQFKRAAHLSDHLAGVHGDTRPFKCRQCDRAFALETYLKRHERLHGGEREHGCDVCGKRFFKKYNLQAHLKTHEVAPVPAAVAAGFTVPTPAAPLASGLAVVTPQFHPPAHSTYVWS